MGLKEVIVTPPFDRDRLLAITDSQGFDMDGRVWKLTTTLFSPPDRSAVVRLRVSPTSLVQDAIDGGAVEMFAEMFDSDPQGPGQFRRMVEQGASRFDRNELYLLGTAFRPDAWTVLRMVLPWVYDVIDGGYRGDFRSFVDATDMDDAHPADAYEAWHEFVGIRGLVTETFGMEGWKRIKEYLPNLDRLW